MTVDNNFIVGACVRNDSVPERHIWEMIDNIFELLDSVDVENRNEFT